MIDVQSEKENSEIKENESFSRSVRFQTMIFFQVFAYGSYSVLVHLCEENGEISFSSTTMNLVIELTKFFLSIVAEFIRERENCRKIFTIQSFWHSLPYSIPALLYFVNNNLAVHMQLQMDPASYQILANFKIVTTAILYRLIIKKTLSKRQWFAVCLLFCGGLFYSLGKRKTKNFFVKISSSFLFFFFAFSRNNQQFGRKISRRNKWNVHSASGHFNGVLLLYYQRFCWSF